MSELAEEPATLSLWDQIIKSIESKAKHTIGLSDAIADVKVTDIFFDWRGEVDENAVSFWSQLIASRGIKSSIETEFQGQLKRGGTPPNKVQQIPLRKDIELSEGFKENIRNKIRQTQSLWTVHRPTVLGRIK
jgi:hypothetical protein